MSAISGTTGLKVFCIERYKYHRNLDGQETLRLFNEYGVMNYLNDCYDALHSLGDRALVLDIDEFISVRRDNLGETPKAVIDHCRKDGLTNRYVIDRLDSRQQKKYINEDNLYPLIISPNSSAEKLEHWAFDEGFPKIKRAATRQMQKLL